MDEFNFFFSFYGLLLGLSVVEIVAGLSRRLNVKQRRSIGLLTPALAVFVLLDITSFWLWTWGMRTYLHVTWGLMFGALLIAVTYYLAASLVFPRESKDAADLDQHYWQNKRLILSGIGFANLLLIGFALHVFAEQNWWAIALNQSVYFGPLGILLVSRSRRIDIAALVLLSLNYLTIPFNLWPSQFGAPIG